MSNAVRKARKRAGVKLEREQKVGTPFEQRVIPMWLDKRSGQMLPSRRFIRKMLGYRTAATEEAS